MTIEYGVPTWTTGGFTHPSGLDDLGIEGVGAGLLRRLLPGIISTTPNAGYYSFYPYLLARWEDRGGSPDSADFKPWYRRQEVAFVTACALHEHRGHLSGLVGTSAIGNAIDSAGEELDLARLASQGPGQYLQAALGGFSMYYGAVLRDLRLTSEGLGRRVDRVTAWGRDVAEAFAGVYEATEYFQRFREVDRVPFDVLRDLGESVCLCTIPDRPDHRPLIDTFFGKTLDDARWEKRRRTRAASLGLFLEWHEQRPDDVEDGLRSWRSSLASMRFLDGQDWTTDFAKTRQSWRLYQIREAETIALLGLWVAFLDRLSETEPAPRGLVRDDLVDSCAWDLWGVDGSTPLGTTLRFMAEGLSTPEELVDAATTLESIRGSTSGEYVARCLAVLAAYLREADSVDEGFTELVGEGGPRRWSLSYLGDWVDRRSSQPISEVLAELIDALVHQHQAIALNKVSPLGKRDPFCIAEDDGLMSVIRMDDPTWSGARFHTVNHLLWTLGLLDQPEGGSRPTLLGREVLEEVRRDA